MIQSLTFQPFLPSIWLLFLGGFPAFFIAIGLITKRRGAFLRLLALASLILALLNPMITKEQREPVKSIVGIVLDHSESQTFGTREEDRNKAHTQLINALAHYPQFEPRFIEAGKLSDNHYAPSTNLFHALTQEISSIPP
ncbi:MAG: hypothetical protein PV354_07285, partial [Bartonella sp.]|nr:hypothetical protein [Bartonella sp.]